MQCDELKLTLATGFRRFQGELREKDTFLMDLTCQSKAHIEAAHVPFRKEKLLMLPSDLWRIDYHQFRDSISPSRFLSGPMLYLKDTPGQTILIDI